LVQLGAYAAWALGHGCFCLSPRKNEKLSQSAEAGGRGANSHFRSASKSEDYYNGSIVILIAEGVGRDCQPRPFRNAQNHSKIIPK
ncbi:MAG: hypothetical protein VX034_15880, partial [Planctomycetota bacterium]|nr:hypothetical protein [Planctomycetota bacterium]